MNEDYEVSLMESHELAARMVHGSVLRGASDRLARGESGLADPPRAVV